ncbi:hypothetical protein [Streptomyces sp. NPDC048603]|uniref:hypothetical protein n=1 Tax=Streptomyces sp. NPDC048603 TaxID=3365577 RepID=UPI003719502E
MSWAAAAVVVVAGGGIGGYVLSDDLRSGFGLRFDRSDVRGRWGSTEGGELLFAPNGDFTAYNISLDPGCDAPGSGLSPERRVSGTGRWTWADGAEIVFRPAGEGFRPCTIRVARKGGKWFRLTHDSGTGEKYRRESHRTPRQ